MRKLRSEEFNLVHKDTVSKVRIQTDLSVKPTAFPTLYHLSITFLISIGFLFSHTNSFLWTISSFKKEIFMDVLCGTRGKATGRNGVLPWVPVR